MPRLASLTNLGFCALLSIGLSGCGSGTPSDPDAAPIVTGKLLDGEYWSSHDALGKVVLVNVWATWCGPCRNELPVLQAAHEQFAGQDFELVGISVDNDASEGKVRAMIGQHALSYRIVLDPNKRVTTDWKVGGYPTSILLDRKGRVAWRKQGEVESGELVEQIEAALASKQ